MDRIIKISLGIFIVVLAAFVMFIGYNGYVEHAYRSSFASSYVFSCTITTDSPLENVTLFIPVPADPDGNSPVLTRISARDVSGLPDTWKTELYDTGKSTLLKISMASFGPPEGTSAKNPFSITIAANVSGMGIIDTRNAAENSPVFRPMMDNRETSCGDVGTSDNGGHCSVYLTALYARYHADPNAAVTITSSLIGRNEWTIFEPRWNEYRNSVSTLMFGGQSGWNTVKGTLREGIGSYDAPVLPA